MDLAAIKHCEIAGWEKKLISSYIPCKVNSLFIKENFSETIWYIGLKISEITKIVMLFQYLEILFY